MPKKATTKARSTRARKRPTRYGGQPGADTLPERQPEQPTREAVAPSATTQVQPTPPSSGASPTIQPGPNPQPGPMPWGVPQGTWNYQPTAPPGLQPPPAAFWQGQQMPPWVSQPAYQPNFQPPPSWQGYQPTPTSGWSAPAGYQCPPQPTWPGWASPWNQGYYGPMATPPTATVSAPPPAPTPVAVTAMGTAPPLHTNNTLGESLQISSFTQGGGIEVPLVATTAAGDSNPATMPMVGLGPPPILHQGVPDRVKAAIVAGEYVEITRLDKETYRQVAYNIKVGDAEDDGVSLQLAKDKEPKRKVLTLEQWSDLFVKYMAIYMAKHPLEAIPILSHYQTVRTLHRKGGDWAEYDRAFRKRKALSQYPWAAVDQQAYAEALNKKEASPQKTSNTNQPFRAQSPINKIPYGFCRKFHTAKEGCDTAQCQWKHQCYQCQGIHKRSVCPNASKRGAGYSQSTRNTRGSDARGPR